MAKIADEKGSYEDFYYSSNSISSRSCLTTNTSASSSDGTANQDCDEDNCSRRTEKSSVSFSCVTVYEFEMELGDNPSCFSGPPVTIGWEPFSEFTQTVDDYERIQEAMNRNLSDSLPILSHEQRYKKLRRLGYPAIEIHNAMREAICIQRQRLKDANAYRRRCKMIRYVKNLCSFKEGDITIHTK